MINIDKYRTQIASLCDGLPVKRLGLFGSSLTDDFNEESDIDVLIVFDRSEDFDHFNKYFEVKEGLESIFNRSVDLVIDKRFKNPYFQKVVDKTRRVVYER